MAENFFEIAHDSLKRGSRNFRSGKFDLGNLQGRKFFFFGVPLKCILTRTPVPYLSLSPITSFYLPTYLPFCRDCPMLAYLVFYPVYDTLIFVLTGTTGNRTQTSSPVGRAVTPRLTGPHIILAHLRQLILAQLLKVCKPTQFYAMQAICHNIIKQRNSSN